MTHPLTPREKVAAEFVEMADRAPFDNLALKTVIICQDEIDALKSILTALASGSGDHAELTRLAEILMDEARGVAKMPRNERRDEQAGYSALASVAMTSLLAENEALRAKVGLADVLGEKLERRTFALDEAERKLAEAREIIQHLEWSCEQLAATRSQAAYDQMISDGQAQTMLELDNARRAARTFLSKEAERG